MKQILIYGDSLTWGIIPNTRQRLPFEKRWPGVLEAGLLKQNRSVRVIEDCLNGRRTVFEDPFNPGRNGLAGLSQRIELNSPLALVVLMLGTNDFQSMHPHTAWHSARGIATLIQEVKSARVEPGMPVSPVLLVIPPLIQEPKGLIAEKFLGAEHKCKGLIEAYTSVAEENGCEYFDANTVTSSSKVDGIHLDEEQHLALGENMVSVISKLIV